MIGKQIGSYLIQEKLGEGGMGTVYKALETNLDRPVAIKVLNTDLARDASIGERFRSEARAQANLNHTNIATLYSFLVVDGAAMMVMEFVEGETFQSMVDRRGPIPAQEAIPLFKQALLGLGAAHRMGIIHRDIKPANLMLNRSGIVKVMDFGIAKAAGGARGLTRTGIQVGTVFYMSPEQVKGEPVDIRSDIYALGVTLYEMLTAHVPFSANSDFQILTDHVSTAPPLPTRFYPYIPKGIENIVLKALEKAPDDRFQTVEEFGAALERPEYWEGYVPRSAVAAGPSYITPPPQNATRMDTGAGYATPLPIPPATPPPGWAPNTPPPGWVPGQTPPPMGYQQQPPATPPPVSHGLPKWLIAGALAAVALLGAITFFILRPKPTPPRPPGNTVITANNGSGGGSSVGGGQGGGTETLSPLVPGGGGNQGGGDQTADKDKGGQQQTQGGDAKNKKAAKPKQDDTQHGQQQGNGGGNNGNSGGANQDNGNSGGNSNGNNQQTPPPPPPPPPVPVVAQVVVPASTPVTIRMIDTVDEATAQPGQLYSASIDQPVSIGGKLVVPRGANAQVRLVSAQKAGHFHGAAKIEVALANFTVSGRRYDVDSLTYAQEGDARGKRTGKWAAIGGAVGAVAGGLAHGAKGAVEGAAAGAGAGAGGAAVTGSTGLKIASESRITFTLNSPVTVTVRGS